DTSISEATTGKTPPPRRRLLTVVPTSRRWHFQEGVLRSRIRRQSSLGDNSLLRDRADFPSEKCRAIRMRRRSATSAGSRRSIDRGVRLIGDDGSGGRDCEPGPGCRDLQADDNKWTVPSRGPAG